MAVTHGQAMKRLLKLAIGQQDLIRGHLVRRVNERVWSVDGLEASACVALDRIYGPPVPSPIEDDEQALSA